jgi:hypothetical protein
MFFSSLQLHKCILCGCLIAAKSQLFVVSPRAFGTSKLTRSVNYRAFQIIFEPSSRFKMSVVQIVSGTWNTTIAAVRLLNSRSLSSTLEVRQRSLISACRTDTTCYCRSAGRSGYFLGMSSKLLLASE